MLTTSSFTTATGTPFPLNVSAGIKRPHFRWFCNRPSCKMPLPWAFEHTYATTPCNSRCGALTKPGWRSELEDTRPSCAVGENGSGERSSVFGVPAERCGRDLKPADAIIRGPFAICHIGSRETGVGKIRNPAGEIHAAILQSEHRQQTIFLLQDGEHLAQPDDNAKRR